jgi:ketosteroid isomerase-like protein
MTESIQERDPLAADRAFFVALKAADRSALDRLLTSDFVLVDVMMGSEIPRAGLLDAIFGGQIVFEAIDVLESRVRRYPGVAIVTGRTAMRGRAGSAEWSANSRYTHVFVEEGGQWRLASAQGTPIVDDAKAP